MSKDNLEPISFINKIVNHITELGLDMEHLSLIVPSDRAANQLRVQIAKTLSIPIWRLTSKLLTNG
jgi:acetolactate synthase regulatory subunit